MAYALRRVRPSLIDYYVVNRERLFEDLSGGSWDLLEGVGFATEYSSIEELVAAQMKRPRVSVGEDDETTLPDDVQQEIEARAQEIEASIRRDGFYIDRQEGFVVLPCVAADRLLKGMAS